MHKLFGLSVSFKGIVQEPVAVFEYGKRANTRAKVAPIWEATGQRCCFESNWTVESSENVDDTTGFRMETGYVSLLLFFFMFDYKATVGLHCNGWNSSPLPLENVRTQWSNGLNFQFCVSYPFNVVVAGSGLVYRTSVKPRQRALVSRKQTGGKAAVVVTARVKGELSTSRIVNY